MTENQTIETDLSARYSTMQLRVITDEHPVKQVIAAAGSGKTRTILGLVAYRLQQRLELPGGILMLTFSRKAAAEMRGRLDKRLRNEVEISTFHSFAYRSLARLHPDLSRSPPHIIEEEEKRTFYAPFFRRYAPEIGGIPFSLLMNNEALFHELFPRIAAEIEEAFLSYKRERGALEYGDLIAILLNDLQKNESYLSPLRSRFGLIVIDEFQDTDPVQLDFLKAMNAPRIVVVGDDWQAIYGFRGASVAPFFDFHREFPSVRRYYLSQNYRSLGPIVTLGNRMIRASHRQIKKRVVAVRGRKRKGSVSSVPLSPGAERSFLETISFDHDFRILARSNYRCEVWRESGCPEANVMTIHKAKGLEFHTVYLDLLGGWYGFTPAPSKKRIATNDEEIRIAYVGLSRAMDRLVILYNPLAGEEEPEGALWRLFRESL